MGGCGGPWLHSLHPLLLGVPISALHDTSVPVEELGRGRLGGMAHGGRTGLTVLSVLVSKPWKSDFSTNKVSGYKVVNLKIISQVTVLIKHF